MISILPSLMAEAFKLTTSSFTLKHLMFASFPVSVEVMPRSSQSLRPSNLAAVSALFVWPDSLRPLFTAEVIQLFCAHDFPKTTPKVNIKNRIIKKISFFMNLNIVII